MRTDRDRLNEFLSQAAERFDEMDARINSIGMFYNNIAYQIELLMLLTDTLADILIQKKLTTSSKIKKSIADRGKDMDKKRDFAIAEYKKEQQKLFHDEMMRSDKFGNA